MKQTPSDFCKLWLQQNDSVERDADQKAFDELPRFLREIVNDSPIQISCPDLLSGCEIFGPVVMKNELKRLLDEWQSSFSSVSRIIS